MKKNNLFILLGPLAFVLILLTGPYDGMSSEALAVLASTVWIALWWITEAVPIPITSLLPLILFPLTGGLDLASTGAAFGNKIIFLYLGGFLIAIAIERWNLHRRIALQVISAFGTRPKYLVLGFMSATFFLSMWISNTATSVMMLPIGIALIKQFDTVDQGRSLNLLGNNFGKVLMLGIAYAASIGGMATLIGTPPNIVLAGVVSELYGREIGFVNWLIFALPLALTLMMFIWFYLVNYSFDMKSLNLNFEKNPIGNQLAQLGKISFEEKTVLVVFVLTALAWIFRSFLLVQWFPALDDTIIALIGASLLFMLPTKDKSRRRIMDWEAAAQLPWGIILLFGGGLAIAAAFESSGLAGWIAGNVSLFQGVSLAVLLLIILITVNFLTEITSNTATTSMVLPILAPIAFTMDVHPYGFLFGAALAASCAFMLPVATPPNAVVFGSGYLRMKDMIKTGFLLNLVSVLVIFAYVYYLLPWIWGLDLHSFPDF